MSILTDPAKICAPKTLPPSTTLDWLTMTNPPLTPTPQNGPHTPNRCLRPWPLVDTDLPWIFTISRLSLSDFITGIPQMGRLVGEMFHLRPIASTIAMAILERFGRFIGIVISFFLAIMAARNLSPHKRRSRIDLLFSHRMVLCGQRRHSQAP